MTPVFAEEVGGQEWDTVIRLWGATDEVSFAKFQQEADQAIGKVVVSLSGPGGFVGAALKISRIIQDRDFATVVEPGKQCGSMCAVVFLSSRHRFMTRFGTVDVHSVYQRDGVTGERHKFFGGNKIVADILRRSEVPQDIIYYIESGDPDEFLPLSPKIARNMGLVFTEY
jgi:hypothetical protein